MLLVSLLRFAVWCHIVWCVAAVYRDQYSINLLLSDNSMSQLPDYSQHSSSLPILGSNVTLTCTLELNSAIVASEIFLLMVDTQLSRDGTPMTLTGPTIRDTTFTYTMHPAQLIWEEWLWKLYLHCYCRTRASFDLSHWEWNSIHYGQY